MRNDPRRRDLSARENDFVYFRLVTRLETGNGVGPVNTYQIATLQTNNVARANLRRNLKGWGHFPAMLRCRSLV